MSPHRSEPDRSSRCPCGLGLVYGECCGPIIGQVRNAATPEALMRSRFAAFAIGHEDHLLATWHPDTRPVELALDDDLRWYRLDVESTTGGTPFESSGEVVFSAYYRVDGQRGVLRERSRFMRVDGRWYYVDGKISQS